MVKSDKDIRIVEAIEPINWGEIRYSPWTTYGHWTDGGLSFDVTVEHNEIRVDQFRYRSLHNVIVLMRWTVKERAVKRWNKKRRRR